MSTTRRWESRKRYRRPGTPSPSASASPPPPPPSQGPRQMTTCTSYARGMPVWTQTAWNKITVIAAVSCLPRHQYAQPPSRSHTATTRSSTRYYHFFPIALPASRDNSEKKGSLSQCFDIKNYDRNGPEGQFTAASTTMCNAGSPPYYAVLLISAQSIKVSMKKKKRKRKS